jgi:tRNA threonylcarbamoyladenosine biosynthesis protein TsaE
MSVLKALEAGVKTFSNEGTVAVGRALARELPSGGTLALYGDLGAGKTTLVRGLAEAMGYHDITSPSFNYYFLYQAQGRRTLLHLDAYRLRSPEEYPSLMIGELLDPQAILVVEWPEKLGKFLPQGAFRLQIEGVGASRRLAWKR